MTRTEFAEAVGDAVRENVPRAAKPDTRPLYAIAAAIGLLAVLMLPVSILAIEAIFAQVWIKQKIDSTWPKKSLDLRSVP